MLRRIFRNKQEGQEGKEVPKDNFQIFRYENQSQAAKVYESLDRETKQQMARVYQEAFGGYPWFEAFRCQNCGSFAADREKCKKCGQTDLGEAYPTADLVESYFPSMLADYTPGVLIVSRSPEGEVVGFSTGGGIKLGELVQKKYQGKTQILDSILRQTGLSPKELVAYENETCVLPSMQKGGIGRRLNRARISELRKSFASICGRTINQPWLNLKTQQLAQAGFAVQSFVPDGDDYEVDGKKRFFFLAKERPYAYPGPYSGWTIR